MPKRACPFDNDFLPQNKIHIGQKQINTGVSNDKLMQNVYDKTLNMLKTGMKAFSHRINTSAQVNVDLPSSQSPSFGTRRTTSNLKQMLLTNNLQLKASDKINDDMKLEFCGCCQIINQSVFNKCYYCDQILCSSYLSACERCLELFCQNCFVPVYNDKEQNTCFSCYR